MCVWGRGGRWEMRIVLGLGLELACGFVVERDAWGL